MVKRLFLAVPWGCLRFVIVVFPDHTHYYLFSKIKSYRLCSFKWTTKVDNIFAICDLSASIWNIFVVPIIVNHSKKLNNPTIKI